MIGKIFKGLVKLASAHQTEILFAAGTAMTIGTVAITIIETKKAIEKVEQARIEECPEDPESVTFTIQEKAKMNAGSIAKVVSATGGSIACYYLGYRKLYKQAKIFGGLYGTSKLVAKAYSEEIKSEFDEDKEQNIRRRVAERIKEERGVLPGNEKISLIVSPGEKIIVREPVSEYEFDTTINSLDAAFNYIHATMLVDDEATVCDLISEATNDASCRVGQHLMWSTIHIPDIRHGISRHLEPRLDTDRGAYVYEIVYDDPRHVPRVDYYH